MGKEKYNLHEETSGNSGTYLIKSGDPKEFYELLGEHFSAEQGNSSSKTELRSVFIEGIPVYMKQNWNYVIITREGEKIKGILEDKIEGFELERIKNKIPHKFLDDEFL